MNWIEGNALEIDLEKQVYKRFTIKAEKHTYLGRKFPCSPTSTYECFRWKFLNSSFDHCPNKCVPYQWMSTEKESIPVCNNFESWSCSLSLVLNVTKDIIHDNEECPRACTTLQYVGWKVAEQKFANLSHQFFFTYQFNQPHYVTAYTEYLIYDSIGMIASVGGTLGMCIGFSFNHAITYLINMIKGVTLN